MQTTLFDYAFVVVSRVEMLRIIHNDQISVVRTEVVLLLALTV